MNVRTVLGAGIAVTLAAFGFLAWGAWLTAKSFESVSNVELELQRNVGTIVHLDEVLTMSARMGAATGDRRWEARYRKYEPELDKAIKGAMALAPDAAAATAETDAANVALIELENQSFERSRAGDAEGARKVLFSDEYERQKAIYAKGASQTNAAIERKIDSELIKHRQNALLLSIGAAFALVMLSLGWIMVLRFLRRTEDSRRQAEQEALSARATATAKEKEMEIAAKIQTQILPREPNVTGASVAAAMVPASEVGGDYYEVIPVEDGSWIAIGDVSGHGISAGVVMLMVQSAFASIVRQDPHIAPSRAVDILNRTLFENLRRRLRSDDHVTLTVLRYYPDGRLVWAGAHEDMLVFRAQSGSCERLRTPGTWIGAVENVGRATVDSSAELRPGDVLVLHTDGITEAPRGGERFGMDRLQAVVEGAARGSAESVRAAVVSELSGWMDRQEDDFTVVVVKHGVEAAPSVAA
ncbi:MAG TPA: PP2C family protein-serine/threonine phosphatase [Polyangiaceae bacterium]|nr:PP2C family protein-serine/threonine phosphatase [Polyangiaceae bacterium]